MTNPENFTMKEMLVMLMDNVEKLTEKLDLANKKQDERIEKNTSFRENTIAIYKVFGAVIGSGAVGWVIYFAYGIMI